jgi:hypothetical protein
MILKVKRSLSLRAEISGIIIKDVLKTDGEDNILHLICAYKVENTRARAA